MCSFGRHISNTLGIVRMFNGAENVLVIKNVFVTVVVKCVVVGVIPAACNTKSVHSCFSSDRINLSPFTKDFRGEEHYEYKLIF